MNLREAMIEGRILSSELGPILGVTPSAVNHWLKGDNLPTQGNREKIDQHFGKVISWRKQGRKRTRKRREAGSLWVEDVAPEPVAESTATIVDVDEKRVIDLIVEVIGTEEALRRLIQ